MPITTVESLRQYLQKALIVELFTIPPYLYALYSIKEHTNRAIVATIQSVVIEEMLHMALVANLLNAVGGTPRLCDRRLVPVYPDYLPYTGDRVHVPLQKLSRRAIKVFKRIEEPKKVVSRGGQNMQFKSIGDLYDAILEGFEQLSNADGQLLFSGNPSRQVTREHYYGGAGEAIEVRDLESAREAIREIVEQGEGLPFVPGQDRSPVRKSNVPSYAIDRESRPAYLHTRFSGDIEPSHYFRFEELLVGRYFQLGDTKVTGPRGPLIPIEWTAVHSLKQNPKMSQFPANSPVRVRLEECNRCYTRLLLLLERGFNGRPKALMEATGIMHEIKQRALELVRTPCAKRDVTVGPSFEFIEL